jgi:hypothetical protein
MEQDPPREPTVERVEREDGRYILYFSWPETDTPQRGEAGREAAPDGDE